MSTEDARLDQMLDDDGVLVLSGEIDSYTTSDLATRLAGDPQVDAIDLAGITFIDSSGLRTLIEADRSRRRGRPGTRHPEAQHGGAAPVRDQRPRRPLRRHDLTSDPIGCSPVATPPSTDTA